MKSITKPMERKKILEQKAGRFKVEKELWLTYKAHFGQEWAQEQLQDLQEDKREEEKFQQQIHRRQQIHQRNYLRNRMYEWIKFKNIKMGPESAHLFLKGDLLDSLLRDLIPLTKSEMMVVNPYVERCAFSDLLIQASERGVKVTLITQNTDKDYSGRRKQDKQRYHKQLHDSSIEVHYNGSVHAKLLILDNQVLSVSSMNLYSESVAGKLWEAGMVTVEPINIQRAIGSFNELVRQ